MSGRASVRTERIWERISDILLQVLLNVYESLILFGGEAVHVEMVKANAITGVIVVRVIGEEIDG